ncbi:hypothetical protein GE21DRAFT_1342841 [Neurospora crassa]|nr:hypothetical protein GE21DRAFT_1342841 [Neurospora crassa]
MKSPRLPSRPKPPSVWLSSSRMMRWESGDYSVRVREPAESGYHLTHITILASCPMPPPTDRALCRLLILGMESILSSLLWTMHPIEDPKRPYDNLKIHSIWPTKELPWTGLCSHNCLTELPRGSMTHLTVKQRVEIFDKSEANKRRLEKMRKRSDQNPASIKAFTARSNAKWNPVEQAKRKLVKKARILFYDVCSVSFATEWHQRHHNNLPRHKANVAAARARAEAEAELEAEFEPGWEDEFDDGLVRVRELADHGWQKSTGSRPSGCDPVHFP